MLVIHCPACAAGLRLPRATLAKRARRICCALCEHRWIEGLVIDLDATPQAPTPPVPVVASTEPSAPVISLLAENARSERAEAEARQPPAKASKKAKTPQRPARALQRTWLVKVAACVALTLILASLSKRELVVSIAPPLAGAYAAIGLPVNLQGLEWRDVKTRVVMEASQKVLAVEGEIRNLRDHTRSLPDIKLSLRDSAGQEVYAWTTAAPRADIEGGETIQFLARLAAPPAGAKAVRVLVAEAEPAAR